MQRVLITDAHAKQALAITQSLARRGIEVSLVSPSSVAPAFALRACRQHFVSPSYRDEAAYVSFLLDVVRRQPYDLLITCFDVSALSLSRAREQFEPHVRLILPEHRVVETTTHKDLLSRFALTYGIPIAQTYFPTTMEEVRAAAAQLSSPIVVKGVRGSGSRQIRYCSRQTVERAVQEVLDFGPSFNPRWPILQEYIPGENKTVYVLCDRGAVLALVAWEIDRSYPVQGGVPAKARAIRDERLEQLARRVVEAIGWHGVAGVAFRLDHRDGCYKLLEVNIRFGGTTQVAIAAGVDLPYLLWRRFVEHQPIKPTTPRLGPRPWPRGPRSGCRPHQVEGSSRAKSRDDAVEPQACPGGSTVRAGVVYRSVFPEDILHLVARPSSLGRFLWDFLNPRIDYGLRGASLRVLGRLVRTTWWELCDRFRARTLQAANGTIPLPRLPVVPAARQPRAVARPTLRRLVKIALSYAAFYSGVVALVRGLRALLKRNEFAVFMYHRLLHQPDPYFAGLSARAFERQIRYLRCAYRPLALKTVLERLAAGQPLPRGTVAVTFDDGHPSAATIAAPILRRYGVPATMFVVSGATDQRRPLWTETVNDVMARARLGTAEVRVDGWRGRYQLTDVASRQRALADLRARLKRLPDEERLLALAQLPASLSASGGTHPLLEPPLTWTQLAALAQDGWEIGAHTVHHPILTRLAPERALAEICESKRQIEERLGHPATMFCYPNGTTEDFDPRVQAMVHQAGFVGACTTIEGRNDGRSDRFALRRVQTSETALPVFAAELAGLFELPELGRALGELMRERLMDAGRWCVEARSLTVLERSLRDPVTLVTPTADVQIRELSASEAETVTAFRPYLTWQVIQRRLQRGDRCFVAVHHGRVVHCSWVAFSSSYNSYVRRTIRLGDGHAYCYNSFTDPALRGRKLMQAVRAIALARLRTEGYRTVLSMVIPTNGASLAALRHVGFTPVGRITYRCVWGRRTWSVTHSAHATGRWEASP